MLKRRRVSTGLNYLVFLQLCSRPGVFCKKGVLRNLTKFTGKHQCQTCGLSPATSLKRRHWHRCFPMNFIKLLRTPFLKEHLRWLLLKVCLETWTLQDRSSHRTCSVREGVCRNFAGKHLCQSPFFDKAAGFRSANLLKKGPWHTCFPVNFVKFLRTPFSQNTSGGCF